MVSGLLQVNKQPKSFSAVGYFFAVEFYKNLNVPIGILHSSMGGSPIESWISENKLRNIGTFLSTPLTHSIRVTLVC